MKTLFVLGSLGCGGAERIAVDIAKRIKCYGYIVDFLVPSDCDCFYKDILEQIGCTIYFSPRFKLFNVFQYRRWASHFFARHRYDIVHFHQVTMVTTIADDVHAMGAKIVTHVHSSGFRGSKVGVFFKKLVLKNITEVSDICLACSENAGKAYYGPSFDRKEKCVILPNAIDVNRFCFNSEFRECIRKEYAIPSTTKLIGNIGSLTSPKNHRFLIDIFEDVYEEDPSLKMMFVGDGDLRSELEAYANEKKCRNSIIFTGSKPDVEKYYSAIDLFIAPSLFEGFSLATLEAQTNGLYCIVSENIPEEALVCRDSVKKVNLASSLGEWRDAILCGLKVGRNPGNKGLISRAYGIDSYIEKINQIYADLVESD